ncbi:MAG: AAA family ATPase [Muribaculaceae bacterium]|nr:AAA family ATPase [Muribaculaceae bacterium]
MRENGYVYVDKTDIIYHLVHNPKYVFLARPRRFGKSLLLSTIETYFKGYKECFKGLAIESLEKEWRKHPVFHLELSGMEKGNFLSLIEELERQFRNWEEKYEIEKKSDVLSSRFRDLIQKTSEKTGEKVVILIDEYDNPLVNSLDDDSLHDKCRNLLKSVYSAIKGMDRFIRFAMITGVSRFSKTSIFSGLNNLNDISFDDAYATICGFTQQDIVNYFKPDIREFANKRGVDEETMIGLLKERYDGYHFSGECIDTYNPFSLLNALEKSSLGNYWIMSGTPTFLIERLKATDIDFVNTFRTEENAESLGTVDVASFSPVALMYQTGYLTIKSYDPYLDIYTLGIPNKEVNYGMFSALLADFSRKDPVGTLKTAMAMKESLTDGNPEKFLELLKTFYAGIPFSMHPNRYELNFEKILYSLLHLMDIDVRSEVQLADGRIDLLIKTDKYIYIIELKLDSSPEAALQQI